MKRTSSHTGRHSAAPADFGPIAAPGAAPAPARAHGLDRELQPEWLDILPAEDPRASRSRRDLRVINALMGNAGHIAAAARRAIGDRPAAEVIDVGAGDGTLTLRFARRLAPGWRQVEVILVDRRALVSRATRRGFEALAWKVTAIEAEAEEWLGLAPGRRSDLMTANLFLHHFDPPALRRLLELVSRRTDCFIACEPRRSRRALWASRCLGWIGCNAVTRHDAVLSVRAGFTAGEISALWPATGEWDLEETPRGWFSHCFVARRHGTQRQAPGGASNKYQTANER